MIEAVPTFLRLGVDATVTVCILVYMSNDTTYNNMINDLTFRKGDGFYYVYSGTTHLGIVCSGRESTPLFDGGASYSYGSTERTVWRFELAPQWRWAGNEHTKYLTARTRKDAAKRMARMVANGLASV